MSAKDITGQKFGTVTAIRLIAIGHNGPSWWCKCECGVEKPMLACNLPGVRSCGCLTNKLIGKANTKHGMCRSPEYIAWRNMLVRCDKPRASNYDDYGGRGITVCERWRDSFENFFSDMGSRPSNKHSIDRYPDTNGNYEPSNCRWATAKEQANNRRSTRVCEFRGETKPLTVWCDELGLPYEVVLARLHYYGWTVERAFTTPKRILTLKHRS